MTKLMSPVNRDLSCVLSSTGYFLNAVYATYVENTRRRLTSTPPIARA